jgi:hypothetical protein
MARAKRRLNATAMALSIAAHAVVLTALALHAPRLTAPREEAGPPEPIIPILIMPRTPPAPPGSTQKPQPIRLHRRQLHREVAPPPEVTPFVAPREAATPPPSPRRPLQPRITVTPSPSSQISQALRRGLVGCANPSLLSPGERDRCLEQLGRGAAEAPYLPPAIGAAKQADLERAGQTKLERRREKEAAVPLGAANGDSDSGAGYRNKPLKIPDLPPLRP